jgi:hypothetical protein
LPAKPRWLGRVADIKAQVSQLTTPVLDRRTIEHLFGVRRRRANELIASLVGFESSNVYLIDREALVAASRRTAESGAAVFEAARRQKIADQLISLDSLARARSVTLPVRPAESGTARLPSGITVLSGKLTVEFDSAEQLFARMYELAQTAAVDFERARILLEPPAPLAGSPTSQTGFPAG